jgi:hypothetical protein
VAEIEDACGAGCSVAALKTSRDGALLAAIADDNKHVCLWRFP